MSPTVGNNGGVGFQSASGNFDPVDSNTDVFVNFDGCSPIRLELNDSLVSDMQTKEACEIFSKTTTVEPTGNLTLKAHRIALGPDFTVDAGAILTLGDL